MFREKAEMACQMSIISMADANAQQGAAQVRLLKFPMHLCDAQASAKRQPLSPSADAKAGVVY